MYLQMKCKQNAVLNFHILNINSHVSIIMDLFLCVSVYLISTSVSYLKKFSTPPLTT